MMVERLFLAVPWPWGCLRFVIVVFPDHTHYFLSKHFQMHYFAGALRANRFCLTDGHFKNIIEFFIKSSCSEIRTLCKNCFF